MKRNHRLWEDLAGWYSIGLCMWREDNRVPPWKGNANAYYQFVTCRDLIRRRLPDEPRGLRLMIGAEIADALRRYASRRR
jgi:hypothetical protein